MKIKYDFSVDMQTTDNPQYIGWQQENMINQFSKTLIIVGVMHNNDVNRTADPD